MSAWGNRSTVRIRRWSSIRNVGSWPMKRSSPQPERTRRVLGLDHLGTVAAGKSADCVVLDENPLDDNRNTARISQVYLRGDEVVRANFLSGVP